jgi:DNA-binding MarR family transcriptional regulator
MKHLKQHNVNLYLACEEMSLSKPEQHIYLCLLASSNENNEDNVAEIDYRTLARYSRVSESTTKKAIKSLKEKKIITVSKGCRKPNSYRIEHIPKGI